MGSDLPTSALVADTIPIVSTTPISEYDCESGEGLGGMMKTLCDLSLENRGYVQFLTQDTFIHPTYPLYLILNPVSRYV